MHANILLTLYIWLKQFSEEQKIYITFKESGKRQDEIIDIKK